MMSFLFFLNHTTEGRTLNLPESFSRVANNLINEKENELCGVSGYYQDGLPDTYQGKSIHTNPPRRKILPQLINPAQIFYPLLRGG